MSTGKRAGTLGVLAGLIALFVAGRWLGPHLFTNNWSFVHWSHLPWYFGPLWVAAVAVACFVAYRYADSLDRAAGTTRRRLAVAAGLLLALWLFRFDSFVFSGANTRIGEIAHAERIGGVVVYRWFEFGTMLLADQFHCLLTSLGTETTRAGVLVWQVIGFVSAMLSLAAAWRLARVLTDDSTRRVWLAVLAFFGPQTLLYLGYIGVESIIVAFSMWVGALAVESTMTGNTRRLVTTWLILIVGLMFHSALAYLIPAVLYVSLVVLVGKGRATALSLIAAGASLVALTVVLYMRAGSSLEVASQVLFLDGKKPFGDYGLFSARHIGDYVQLLFLVAPLIVLYKWMAIRRLREFRSDAAVVAAWLAAAGGAMLVFVLDPVHSMPLDLPRFAAYLAPVSLATAALVGSSTVWVLPVRQVAAVAAVAVMLPTAYLPVYVNLDRTDRAVEPYVSAHPGYYQSAAIAFRDAHFYRRDFARASEWEQQLSTQSEAFIHLQGCLFLAGSGRSDEAIPRLYQLIAGYPFWWEPRAVLARTQLSSGQPHLARPQIDSALLLEPYNREALVLRYEYYRTLGKPDSALDALEYARRYFPADTFIMTDRMLLTLRTGDYRMADSLATDRLTQDSLHAHAWYVKGVLADRAGLVTDAIYFYGRFLDIGPADPDTTRVRRRMETLKTALQP